MLVYTTLQRDSLICPMENYDEYIIFLFVFVTLDRLLTLKRKTHGTLNIHTIYISCGLRKNEKEQNRCPIKWTTLNKRLQNSTQSKSKLNFNTPSSRMNIF